METGCPVLAYTEFPPPDTIEFFSDSASVSCEHVRHEFNAMNENKREISSLKKLIILINMSQPYNGLISFCGWFVEDKKIIL
jgi:hypothetical protein